MKITVNKILGAFARFFSTVLSPLLMPALGVFLVLWTSVLCYLPTGTRTAVLAVVFGITAILPMIAIALMHNFGLITDKRLVERKERMYPFAFTFLCYVVAEIYIRHIHSPEWFYAFMLGAALAALVTLIVTFFWKISAHMAGIGGIVALLYQIHLQGLGAFSTFGLLCATILLAGCLGTSRLILGRHNLLQVLAGFVNGFTCVTIMMMLIG